MDFFHSLPFFACFSRSSCIFRFRDRFSFESFPSMISSSSARFCQNFLFFCPHPGPHPWMTTPPLLVLNRLTGFSLFWKHRGIFRFPGIVVVLVFSLVDLNNLLDVSAFVIAFFFCHPQVSSQPHASNQRIYGIDAKANGFLDEVLSQFCYFSPASWFLRLDRPILGRCTYRILRMSLAYHIGLFVVELTKVVGLSVEPPWPQGFCSLSPCDPVSVSPMTKRNSTASSNSSMTRSHNVPFLEFTYALRHQLGIGMVGDIAHGHRSFCTPFKQRRLMHDFFERSGRI